MLGYTMLDNEQLHFEVLILHGFDVGAIYKGCAALGWSMCGGHSAAVARELGLGSECGDGAGSSGADGGDDSDGSDSDGGSSSTGDSLEDAAVLVLAGMLGYTPLGDERLCLEALISDGLGVDTLYERYCMLRLVRGHAQRSLGGCGKGVRACC